MKTTIKQPKETTCKHPPARNFAWWAFNTATGKKDILCVGCCACGEVLTGGATC